MSAVREMAAGLAPRAAWLRRARQVAGRRVPSIAATALSIAAFAAVVAFLFNAARRSFPGDSDGATVVLQGQSISGGNLALDGWRTLYDSFWTVDAPFYALGVRLFGVQPWLLYLVPALLAALVVVVGCWLARDGRRGPGGVAAVATVIALLALPSSLWAYFFLRGPLHVGTVLWCLLAFAGLRRARWGLGWACAVVLLAAGLLGDLLTVALGVLPAFVAGVAAMLRTRNWRPGLPAVGASVAGCLLALVVREVAELVGTYAIGPANPRAGVAQMVTNLAHIPEWGTALLGVNVGPFGHGNVPGQLAAVHVLGVLVVVLAVLAGVVGLVHGSWTGSREKASGEAGNDRAWHLDDMLVLACVGDLAIFIALPINSDPNFVRYLVPLVVFGAILAGRLLGRLSGSLDRVQLRGAGALVATLVLAGYVAATVPISTRSTVPQRGAELARFLEAHDLRAGLAPYWDASITTVQSHGKVAVRPVIGDGDGHIVRYGKQSTRDWYARVPFQFLVYIAGVPSAGVNARTAVATFGAPAHTYAVGGYRVAVWSHPISVSSDRYAG